MARSPRSSSPRSSSRRRSPRIRAKHARRGPLTGAARPGSPWRIVVKDTMREYPDIPFRDVLKRASRKYRATK